MKKFILLYLLAIASTGWAQVEIPPLWGHSVHDQADVLSHETIDEIELMLKQHEDSTTNQIAVLILPSLQDESVEELAVRVAHTDWKLGTKDKDNGVLLLIGIEDRKVRIEVGYGLEGVLPDAVTSRIIRNEIAPPFRAQNYEQGVKGAVDAIIKAIGNEYTADHDNATQITDLDWKARLLIGVFVFGILGLFTFVGLLIPGCGGWFLYAFLIPFYATFPMFILGSSGGVAALGTYLIAFPIVKILFRNTKWGKNMISKMGQSNSGSSGSGWMGGSSSRSGWSSGGGGFSGGGGSFGGGGSSGSW